MNEAQSDSGETQPAPGVEETETALALAVIVHDIRTPLGAVSATADLLAATDLTDRQRSYVETLQQAAAALNDLANELIDQAGEIPQEPSTALAWNPAEMLRNLTTLFAPLADEKGVQLKVDIPEALDMHTAGDPRAVRRILTNLIDNAIKFTARFSPAGEVRVEGRLLGGRERRLAVTVSDDGPGIAADELPQLFLPYRQGAAGHRLRSGAGLGLWISRTLAQRLGGGLKAESRLGAGTTFTLDVPCLPASPPFEADVADDVAAVSPSAPRLNVLVVDDNSVNRLLITTFLESFGMTFRAVDGGESALAAAGTEAFDVVIMDLQMPGMDGIEASLRLREMPGLADIPIVALTAGMRPADNARCRRARFARILGKPFAPADLLKALTVATGGGSAKG